MTLIAIGEDGFDDQNGKKQTRNAYEHVLSRFGNTFFVFPSLTFCL